MEHDIYKTFRDIGKQYEDTAKALSTALLPIIEAHEKMMLQLKTFIQGIDFESLSKIPSRLMNVANKASANGWTIPFDAPFQLYWYIEDTDDDLDEVFIEYYLMDSGQNFANLVKGVIEAKELEQWREILQQCVDAYNREHYLITIPVLICCLEGLVSKLTEDKTNIRIIGICQRKLDEVRHDRGGQITEVGWVSVYIFIKTLYEKSNFDNDEPTFINRHWILHGRTQVNWTKADALRLFNAIGTLVTLLEFEE